MTFTLNDFLKKCELAIPIYSEIAEDEGMAGNVELFDYYTEEKDKLEKQIKAIKEQLEIHNIISLSSFMMWMNLDENKAVRDILLDALTLVRDRKVHQVQELQKEIDFCNQFLNSGLESLNDY